MLLGEHNRYNASVVWMLMKRLSTELDIDMDIVADGIAEFTGLAHRLQYIGTYGDVKYYDDSISTINESAIEAVESVPDIATILIGGMDRGIDYQPLPGLRRGSNWLQKRPYAIRLPQELSGSSLPQRSGSPVQTS